MYKWVYRRKLPSLEVTIAISSFQKLNTTFNNAKSFSALGMKR